MDGSSDSDGMLNQQKGFHGFERTPFDAARVLNVPGQEGGSGQMTRFAGVSEPYVPLRKASAIPPASSPTLNLATSTGTINIDSSIFIQPATDAPKTVHDPKPRPNNPESNTWPTPQSNGKSSSPHPAPIVLPADCAYN